jgi:hypothetical protein
MPQCPNCKGTYQAGMAFCPTCGTRTEASGQISYTSSILLGIGLISLILIWQLASVPTPANTAGTVAPPPPPDEAAMLIKACGMPDIDSAEKPGADPNRRSLVYRKARVKAIFGRNGGSWRREAILDTKNHKELKADVVKRRLPCSESTLHASLTTGGSMPN